MGEKFCAGFFGHRWEPREFELTTVFGKVGVFLKYKQLSEDSINPTKVTTIPLSVCYFRECAQKNAGEKRGGQRGLGLFIVSNAATDIDIRQMIVQLQYPSREGRVVQNSFTSLSFGTSSVRTLTMHFKEGLDYTIWSRK